MGVIDRYARDMAAGRWKQTPEPFVFDGEDTGHGVLRDGQQRCFAIIKAGIILCEEGKIAHPGDFSLTVWVTRGTTQEIDTAFPVLNTGKNRTGNDYLAIGGRANPTLLYTVGRRIALWEAGHPAGNNYKPTRTEVLAILEPREGTDPDREMARIALIEEAAAFAANWKIKPPVPPAGIAGFLYWLLGQKNPQDRNTFLEYLRSGSGLADEEPGRPHPLVILRTRLLGDNYTAQVRGAHIKQETVLYLCLRTWDAWRRHEEMSKLQMPTKLTDASFRQPR